MSNDARNDAEPCQKQCWAMEDAKVKPTSKYQTPGKLDYNPMILNKSLQKAE